MIPDSMGTNPEKGSLETETTPIPSNNKRNPRATRSEMERRENAILKLFKPGTELDAYRMAKSLKISYAQASTVVNSLLASGKLERAGLRSRRVVYRLPEARKAVAEKPKAVAKPIDAVKIPLHLGERLEVTEIHMTKNGIQVEVRDNHETFIFALVS